MSNSSVFNVPNQVTTARLVLSIVLFVFLGYECYLTSIVLFSIAAGTDWYDGYYARKYGQVTQLGRILDPFADKIIICGTFIFLVAVPQSEIKAWMAVAVIGRELLVTALRSFLEQRGSDFSASMAGKIKMVLQCAAVLSSLWRLSYLDPLVAGKWASVPPAWVDATVLIFVWSAVVVTIYSGVDYILAAVRIMRT